MTVIDPLRDLAEWLVSMDDPENEEGMHDRQTVTLTKIIDRASEALNSTSVPQTSADVELAPWEKVSMHDLEPGDTIIFGRVRDPARARATVVAVARSKITLVEGGHVYEVQLDDESSHRRDVLRHRVAEPEIEG